MALLQYSNGILEDFKSKDIVFTDQELIGILEDYSIINTLRLVEIPNTWCVWGHKEEVDNIEYNRIASDLIGEPIYSPLLIIHDGELNPDWDLNDPIILTSYKDFKNDVLLFIDDIASAIIDTDNSSDNSNDNSMDNEIHLFPLGSTKDKKILFEFDQTKQKEGFFQHKNLGEFVKKIITYWDKFFDGNLLINDNTCVIYADAKIILIVKDNNVHNLISFLVTYFENIESYETCIKLNLYKKAWDEYIKNDKQVIKLLPPHEINPNISENDTESS